MNIRAYLLFTALALSLCTARAQKLAGGDISMLPRYEQAGVTYYTHDGQSISDLIAYSKQVGMNAMRVRLFVNPKQLTTSSSAPYTWSADDNVCQDLAWVKALGKRIKDAGMKLMLDIHYSDTWADPAKQWTPEAWKDLDDAALTEKVYSYTADALKQLKDAGAEPDLVQTGNEISYGMLWGRPDGSLQQCWPSSTANWDRFANLLKQATKAVRETCPSAKIILHVERVSISQQSDNKEYKVLTNFFSKMNTYGIDYDVIGLSYSPYFQGALSELDGAITKLEAGWPNKEIMVVETGYPYAWAVPGTTYEDTKTWPYSDEGQKQFTDALIAMLNKHSKVDGLFWWWPEYNAKTNSASLSNWYNAPLFDSRTGRATSAFTALAKYATSSTAIRQMSVNTSKTTDDHYYDLSGRSVSQPKGSGVYIHHQKKIIVR